MHAAAGAPTGARARALRVSAVAQRASAGARVRRRLPRGIAADGDEAPAVYLRDEDALGADGHGGPRAGDVVVDLSRPPFEASVVRAKLREL